MAELTPDSAPQVERAVVKPRGVLPGNLKNSVLIGGGILVVLFVLFNSGGPSAKDKKAAAAAEAAKPVVIDPSQARIQEYRKKIDTEAKKLEAEQERLKQVQESMGTPSATGIRPNGALQAMYPPGVGPNALPAPASMGQTAAAVDPIKADREKREYASLFASNVALSYRPATAAAVAETKTEKPVSAAIKDESKAQTSFPPASSFPAALEPIAHPGLPKPAGAVTPQSAVAGDDEETDPDRARNGDRQGKGKAKSPAELRQAEGAHHRLFEGTVLETVLTNRIAADFSGPVNCLVSTNVYSHNRQHLLIPQGSRVLGEVKRVTNFGQQRVAVFFHRLIMPDGFSLDLDQFQGLNQIGETGLKDQVNYHYAQIFGASLALGAIAGFSQAGTSNGLVTSGIDSYREGFSNSLSLSSQRILDKFLNLLPTITIREGYRVKVYLAGDLLVPDYQMHRIPDDL